MEGQESCLLHLLRDSRSQTSFIQFVKLSQQRGKLFLKHRLHPPEESFKLFLQALIIPEWAEDIYPRRREASGWIRSSRPAANSGCFFFFLFSFICSLKPASNDQKFESQRRTSSAPVACTPNRLIQTEEAGRPN